MAAANPTIIRTGIIPQQFIWHADMTAPARGCAHCILSGSFPGFQHVSGLPVLTSLQGSSDHPIVEPCDTPASCAPLAAHRSAQPTDTTRPLAPLNPGHLRPSPARRQLLRRDRTKLLVRQSPESSIFCRHGRRYRRTTPHHLWLFLLSHATRLRDAHGY